MSESPEKAKPSYLLMMGLAFLSSLLLVLSFPDFSLPFLAYFALLPLLYSLTKFSKPRFAFLLGEFTGIGYFYGTCYWITYSMINYGELPVVVAHLLTFILVAIMSLFPATFAAIVNYLIKRFGLEALIFAPFIWASVEFLRLNVPGVGWNMLGYSQSFYPTLIWPASYGGVYLVSALTVLPSAIIALIISKRSRLTISLSITTALLFLTVFLVGKFTIKEPAPPKSVINVIAVQAVAPVNVPQRDLVDSLSRQMNLSVEGVNKIQESSKDKPIMLVAWPEAPYSFAYDRDETWRKLFGDFTQKYQTYLLFNGDTKAPNGDYNSVILIGPNGERVGQYNKIHLLPFGEYVPMRGYLPLIDRVPALAGDYKSDNQYSLIKVADTRIGTSICFESVFPDIFQQTARAGANAFINVANDGWFGPTPISRQHLAHVVMRAVETNRPIYRVTNVGISAYITNYGQIKDETPTFVPALRLWQIPNSSEKLPLTFYTSYGDVFALACLLITILLLFFPNMEKFMNRRK